MGHHLKDGKFQSDKFPSLPPNHVAINITKPRARGAVLRLIQDYRDADPEFAEDLESALCNLVTREEQED